MPATIKRFQQVFTKVGNCCILAIHATVFAALANGNLPEDTWISILTSSKVRTWVNYDCFSANLILTSETVTIQEIPRPSLL